MTVSDKRIVKVGSRLAKYIGTKATREQKLQAASMQVEFSLRDTLIMLSYLGRDPDEDVASKARRNLILPLAPGTPGRTDPNSLSPSKKLFSRSSKESGSVRTKKPRPSWPASWKATSACLDWVK